MPLQVMLPRFWVASTKPEVALRRGKAGRILGEEEGGLWRRVIAGQKLACIAWRGTYPNSPRMRITMPLTIQSTKIATIGEMSIGPSGGMKRRKMRRYGSTTS